MLYVSISGKMSKKWATNFIQEFSYMKQKLNKPLLQFRHIVSTDFILKRFKQSGLKKLAHFFC